jgi:hypothetical protein
MMTRDVDPHLTVLDFDELDLGEIPVDERRRVEAHTARCTTCAARRSQHGALGARFRAVVFPRTAAAVAARRRGLSRRRWPLGLLLLPAMAAALLIVARAPGPRPRDDEAGAPGIGVKGDDLFEVFARRSVPGMEGDSPAVVRVSDGMRLAPGDALRFVLFPNPLDYVLIASVDGAGEVNIYYPFHGDESALRVGRIALSVPGSIVLDDAPGPERLFVISSGRPITAHAVRQALGPTAAGGAAAIRALARVPLDGTVQSTLLFEKEGGR